MNANAAAVPARATLDVPRDDPQHAARAAKRTADHRFFVSTSHRAFRLIVTFRMKAPRVRRSFAFAFFFDPKAPWNVTFFPRLAMGAVYTRELT